MTSQVPIFVRETRRALRKSKHLLECARRARIYLLYIFNKKHYRTLHHLLNIVLCLNVKIRPQKHLKSCFLMCLENRRNKWTNAMRRAHPLGPNTVAYCCEDNFDVENGMENYVKYKLVGGPLKLKKDVLPHKFACQNRYTEKPQRFLLSKLNAKSRSETVAHAIATTSQEIEHRYVVDPVTTLDDNIDIDPLPEEYITTLLIIIIMRPFFY